MGILFSREVCRSLCLVGIALEMVRFAYGWRCCSLKVQPHLFAGRLQQSCCGCLPDPSMHGVQQSGNPNAGKGELVLYACACALLRFWIVY